MIHNNSDRSSEAFWREQYEGTHSNTILKNFCDEHCKVKAVTHEEFFTAEELRKIRQKKPKIQSMYKMEKITLSKYQTAMNDLSIINSIIDII